MGALFIFIFISVLIVSALLFFNKGEKAQEIKSILKDIYANFKELFSNLKKLFLILKDLIQPKLETEPTQLEEKSSSDDSLKSVTSNDSTSISSKELAPPSEDSNTNSTEDSQPTLIAEPEIDTPSKSDNPSEVSISDSTENSQPDLIPDQEDALPSKLDSSTQDLNPNNNDYKTDKTI